ncbi:MAG TPA: serine/threonine-protein kinase, partial [Stenomitos sp.]
MTLSAGSLLKHGQYRIDEVLACGGFGIVYRAIQTDLGLPIVLKTLKAEEPALPLETLKERFLTEARRLMHLRHRHIVQVRDCFMEDGHPFMVMDFIPGFTLAQKIANGPLPAAEALRYIRQIGQALSFIHAQGLLHRDVKPSNIIVDERTQQAILIDFGIARELSPQAPQPNTGILSVGFAALEQYLPAHRWTAATDVYGLAATLYALITGQTPESSVVREQVGLREPHELNPNSSPSLNQAILKGMA